MGGNKKRLDTMSEIKENQKNLDLLNEERFREIYAYERPEDISLTTVLKNNIKCNKSTVFNTFPILKWLPAYKKEYIMSDVIAGLTVGVMHIPQGLGYALLGGVPPVTGIYMALFPVLVYIIMGTSPHVSMGTFAVVCIMVGKSVDTYTDILDVEMSGLNVTHVSPIEIATSICFMVGVWQLLLGILRLGALSVLLSPTLISGFTTGAAVHVLTSQIKYLFGIKLSKHTGPFKIIYTYIDIFTNIGNLNVTATILSVSFAVFLVTFNEFVKPCLKNRFKKDIPLPIELIVVVLGTLISHFLDMKNDYNVSVVDNVPEGLPSPTMPPFQLINFILVDSFVIGIVAVSINLSMATIFAQKLGYEIDGNQEIIASGVGNIFSSFFLCMPFATSLSRSLVQVTAGSKTLVTSVVSAGTLVFILLFVGKYFEELPYCVLSTIIVVALKGMFMQMKSVPEIFRKSKLNGCIWTVVFLTVVILDIDYGLGVGLLASMSAIVLRSQKCEVVVLGCVPNTTTYLNVDQYKKAKPVKNILIVQLVGALHFANFASVKKELKTLLFDFENKYDVSEANAEKRRKHMSLVVDLSCVPFMDPAAIKAFGIFYEEIKALGIQVLLAECQPSLYEALEISKFMRKYPKTRIFHKLEDAVEFGKRLSDEFVCNKTDDYVVKF